jgi:monoamine oxidase
MYQVCNRPVLVALVAGQSAFEIENESDQYVVNKMMKALRKIYGDKIPDPNKFYKTSWHSDPFARGIGNFTTNSGSYSYIKVGSKGGIDYDIMSQRVNRFYFRN